MTVITILYAILTMGALGALFSVGLSIASKKLSVEEDPRLIEIIDLLPGSNCGACGFAGCAAMAEAILKGDMEPSSCPVANNESIEKISKLLGLEVKEKVRNVAVVLCRGDRKNQKKKAEYIGVESCLAAHLVGGGERACNWGCIGFGDCVDVCPFDAIYMSPDGIPVVDRDKCTGCGKCVEACPRNIIELHPINRNVFVLCKNRDNPRLARSVCSAACISCGICERATGGEGFKVIDNLAVVDYEKYTKEPILPTDKCPTKCIVIVGDPEKEK